MKIVRRIYKDRQRVQVNFPECGKDLRRSLAAHCQTQHHVAKGGPGQEGNGDGGVNDPRTNRMAFLAKAGPKPCPVGGCSGRVVTQTAMWMHF